MRYSLAMFLCLAALGCRGPMYHNKALHGGMGPEGAPSAYNLPPAQMMMHPGPGVDGPGPGVMVPGMTAPMPAVSSQVAFVGPDGTMVSWDVTGPGRFDSEPLIVPGRRNFPQSAIYRLKLTNVPARPGIELYPTLEIGPATPRTEAYLAHNAVPVQFTEEDFDQVLTGNFVTKVIYLPDAEYQELAVAGVETLVSTRLDPGVDPIVEADRRGAIMAIVRMGNKDLEVPGNEFMGAEQVTPASYYAPPGMAPSYLSGVTTAPYGMPITGTPIGLPGPPHIPLGGPASMCRHEIHNHTPYCIPGTPNNMQIHVRQDPGFAYPKPVSQVKIHEQMYPGMSQQGQNCEPGQQPQGY